MKYFVAYLSSAVLIGLLFLCMPKGTAKNGLVLSRGLWCPADGSSPVEVPIGVSLATFLDEADVCCSGRYEIEVDQGRLDKFRSSFPGPYAMSISGIGGNFSIRLGGTAVDVPTQDYSSIGLIVPLQNELVERGPLKIEVEMRGPELGFVGLWKGPITIGNAVVLADASRADYLYQVVSSNVSAIVLAVLACMFVWFFFKTGRQFRFYLWFSFSLMTFAVFSLFLSGLVRQYNLALGAYGHYPARTISAGGAFVLFSTYLYFFDPKAYGRIRSHGLAPYVTLFGAFFVFNGIAGFLHHWAASVYTVSVTMFLAGIPILFWRLRDVEYRSLPFVAYVVAVAAVVCGSLDALKLSLRVSGVILPYQYFDRYISPIVLLMSFVIYVRQFTDFFERYQEQVAAAAREGAVARMVQMVAHDVRKPFSKLRMGLGMLRNATSMERVTIVVERVSTELDKDLASVNGMLADILEVGRTARPTLQPCSVISLVHEALSDVSTVRDISNVEVTKSVPSDLQVIVDPSRIRRVLVNLIENAVQATGPTGKLWLHADPKELDGRRWAEITIGNSGSFIAVSDRDRIFDAFYTSGKADGTGLGLAIARKIVEAHGGKVWCVSSKEAGTEFRFLSPAAI